jgi:acyl dehydratase
MSSRSAAKKISRPAAKPHHGGKPAPKKQKLAKVTRFPTNKVTRKPLPPARKAPQPLGKQHPQQHPHAQPAHRNLPALTPPKQVQQPKQSLARSFYWTELRVGDDLPPLTKPAVDRVQIVRYAASSGDFNRLHLDEPYAHQVGFPGLFAPGMLPMAFVGQLLTAWLRRGHVRKLSARFVKIVWPQDELTCRGRIAELRREGGACYADVELWAENQKGELVLRGQATCELYESPQTGGGDGGGLLFALQSTAPAQPASGRKSEPKGKTPSKKR